MFVKLITKSHTDLMKSKHIRLNKFYIWWTVKWYRSTLWRTNVYTLKGLTLGGLWTGYTSTWGRTNVYVLTDLTLGGLWTGLEDHTMWTLLYFDHSCNRMPNSAQARAHPSTSSVKPKLKHAQLSSTTGLFFSWSSWARPQALPSIY
jgi:hypothetical protein